MPWTKIGFGKHTRKTLPQVPFSDPSWFFGAVERHEFDASPELGAEANVILRRATRMRIPPRDGVEQRIDFIVRRGKLWDALPVSADQPRQSGGSRSSRPGEVDLSVPWQIDREDRHGVTRMLRCVKLCVFGDEKKRLSKKEIEAFFSNEDNFVV